MHYAYYDRFDPERKGDAVLAVAFQRASGWESACALT